MQEVTNQQIQSCLHCQANLLPNQEKFCCRGCEFVFKTIQNLGLNNFYQLKDLTLKNTPNNLEPDKSFHYLEDPELSAKILKTFNHEHVEVNFYLPSIHCSACIWILERLPQVTTGIKALRVNFSEAQARIEYDPTIITLPKLASLLHSIGYTPVPVDDMAIKRKNLADKRKSLIQIGIAGLVAVNTMMLNDSLIEANLSGMEDSYRILFMWISAILALPVVTYCALPFYRTAIASLVVGTIHLDLPISIIIILTYLTDLSTIISGGLNIYLDSISCLVFLLLGARYLQHQAVTKARHSSQTAWDLFPDQVTELINGQTIKKRIQELQINDLLQVLPGERVPADGIVIDGESSVDLSFLNGESIPFKIQKDSEVYGGTLNLDGLITVRILAIQQHTRLGKIIEQLKNPVTEKTELEANLDLISRYFVIGVLIAAILTFLFWNFVLPDVAWSRTIALLVITCPCALGLSVPTTIAIAMRQAHQVGLYIKNSGTLQILNKIKNFYFDKTGTLTSGKLQVISANGPDKYYGICQQLACAAPSHPIAITLSNYLASYSSNQLTDLKLYPGKGVFGKDHSDCYFLGSIKWFDELKISIPIESQEIILLNLAKGLSISLVAKNNNLVMWFVLSDTVLEDTASFLKQLEQDHKKISILSGDNQKVVNHLASSFNLPNLIALGDLSHDQKAEIIKNDPETSIMIGDGINDASALQQATLGIGIGGGIEAILESADVYVGRQGLKGIIQLYYIAGQVNKVIKRNLIFSFCYNIIGAGLAFSGYVTPFIAAILMPLSSLIVILSASLTRYTKS